MSDIHESITIGVPFERIPELVERYLTALRRDGRDAIVPLSLTVGDLVIKRDARLEIAEARRSGGYAILDIRWEADGRGPYPAFAGTLCAEQASPTRCRIDLDGSYVPPGNIAGAAFDAVVGNAIARAVARRLLQRFKVAFEDDERTHPAC